MIMINLASMKSEEWELIHTFPKNNLQVYILKYQLWSGTGARYCIELMNDKCENIIGVYSLPYSSFINVIEMLVFFHDS